MKIFISFLYWFLYGSFFRLRFLHWKFWLFNYLILSFEWNIFLDPDKIRHSLIDWLSIPRQFFIKIHFNLHVCLVIYIGVDASRSFGISLVSERHSTLCPFCSSRDFSLIYMYAEFGFITLVFLYNMEYINFCELQSFIQPRCNRTHLWTFWLFDLSDFLSEIFAFCIFNIEKGFATTETMQSKCLIESSTVSLEKSSQTLRNIQILLMSFVLFCRHFILRFYNEDFMVRFYFKNVSVQEKRLLKSSSTVKIRLFIRLL